MRPVLCPPSPRHEEPGAPQKEKVGLVMLRVKEGWSWAPEVAGTEGWLLLAGFQGTAEKWGDRSTELGDPACPAEVTEGH